jgi:chromate reductase
MTRHSDIPTPPATTPALHVLAISGSTRAGSLNAQLLRAAAAAPPRVELVELDPAVIKAIPAFDEDDEARAGGDDIPALRMMRHQIAGADAVLFATPEYNASVPGALKNALDWISRPIAANVLHNKPVAVIGASTGLFGATWAQAELRKILQTIGAKVVDRKLALARQTPRPRTCRRARSGRLDREHGDVAVRQQPVGHAAMEQAAEPGDAPRTGDHEVVTAVLGETGDRADRPFMEKRRRD